jgi:PAS domain-containing protein
VGDRESPSSLADLPLDLDPETLAQAEEIIVGLGRALFPTGTPAKEQLTWPDRPEVEALTDDGSIRSMAERLARAEARFAVLIEQIPAVTFMAVLGEGENEVYVSPHIEQMLGYSQTVCRRR